MWCSEILKRSLLPAFPPPCPTLPCQQQHDGSVFLGLDSNRLARWDLRDPHGVVQQADASPGGVVSYTGGKDYARGTKFRCAVGAVQRMGAVQ